MYDLCCSGGVFLMLHSTLPLEWKIKDGRRYCVRARGLLNGRLILMLVILLIVSEKVERGETEDETGSVSPPVSSRASNLSRSLDTSKFCSNLIFFEPNQCQGVDDHLQLHVCQIWTPAPFLQPAGWWVNTAGGDLKWGVGLPKAPPGYWTSTPLLCLI